MFNRCVIRIIGLSGLGIATLANAAHMGAAGRAGLRWHEEECVIYRRDATAYLRNLQKVQVV